MENHCKLSIGLYGQCTVPKNESDPTHVDAAERYTLFHTGWVAHPIYKGDYPPVMREYIDRNSKAEGRNESRLPRFTKEEIEEIRGTHDYMATNFYFAQTVKPGISGPNPSITRDAYVVVTYIHDPLSCSWFGVSPTGIRKYLKWLRKTYGDQEIFITENGYCDMGGIMDFRRVAYYSGYLENILSAIKDDGIKVIGYTAWSLIDNFEWKYGYTNKFGLIKVDFNLPERPRIWKLSAEFMKEVILVNSL